MSVVLVVVYAGENCWMDWIIAAWNSTTTKLTVRVELRFILAVTVVEFVKVTPVLYPLALLVLLLPEQPSQNTADLLVVTEVIVAVPEVDAAIETVPY